MGLNPRQLFLAMLVYQLVGQCVSWLVSPEVNPLSLFGVYEFFVLTAPAQIPI